MSQPLELLEVQGTTCPLRGERIQDPAYLSIGVTSFPDWSRGGACRGDPGVLGPGLCRILDMNFRELPFHAGRCINAAPRPGQVQVADLVAQLRRDNTAYPPGSTALEVPSTRPERSLARAATYGSVLRTTMAVSNPSRGIDPNDFNLPGCGPTSTSQLATSVAPFQLA